MSDRTPDMRRAAVEIVLVRHGVTADGDPTMLDGQSDPPISLKGAEQAARTAARLVHEAIDSLFVTPLRRTQQTAEPLVEALQMLPTTVDTLREVHLGDVELRLGTSQERRDIVRQILRQQRWDIGHGAETSSAFGHRVALGLETVAKAIPPGGRGVAFVHGGVIAEACRRATGSGTLAFLAHLRHASITRILYSEKRMTLIVFNDAAHLDDDRWASPVPEREGG